MQRTDPPPLATWILEHLTPPDQDEALVGDLLEDFCAGRSEGWYWRQAFGACASGWIQYLRGRTRKAAAAAAAVEQASPLAHSGATMFLPRPDAWSVKKFLIFMLGAGLLNAWIASLLLCRLPADHAPSLRSLMVRAIMYVAIAALAGTGGTWFYWTRSDSPLGADSPVSFRLFALSSAVGWIWMPAILLLAGQGSQIAIPIAVLAAVLLALALRRTLPPIAAFTGGDSSPLDHPPRELFEQTLFAVPRETHGYAIALSIYAAGYLLTHYETFEGSAMLALAAFLFVWNGTLAPLDSSDSATNGKKRDSRAARRLADVALLAVLVTTYALLTSIDLRNTAALDAGFDRGNGGAGNSAKQRAQAEAAGFDLSGYQSIILWPPPKKKLIYAPPLLETALLAPGSKRPLVIRFDGPYWYFQPPNKRPGPKAHQAHATPLGVDIAANNFIPLVMEARQNLGVEIPLARCREIRVGVENRDNDDDSVALAVFLSDEAARGKPELDLGQQPIVSTEPAHFAVKKTPVDETLRFTIPEYARIRRFDQITVMFLTGAGHARVGPKIAIEQFDLVPR